MQESKIIEVDSASALVCPHCAQKLVDEEDCVVVPCEHLMFFYVSLGDFEYIIPTLEERMKEAEAQEDFDCRDFLRNESGAEVILEHTEDGMACGPVSCTAWAGIVRARVRDP